jgi:hypothetical protein
MNAILNLPDPALIFLAVPLLPRANELMFLAKSMISPLIETISSSHFTTITTSPAEVFLRAF